MCYFPTAESVDRCTRGAQESRPTARGPQDPARAESGRGRPALLRRQRGRRRRKYRTAVVGRCRRDPLYLANYRATRAAPDGPSRRRSALKRSYCSDRVQRAARACRGQGRSAPAAAWPCTRERSREVSKVVLRDAYGQRAAHRQGRCRSSPCLAARRIRLDSLSNARACTHPCSFCSRVARQLDPEVKQRAASLRVLAPGKVVARSPARDNNSISDLPTPGAQSGVRAH
jgi:hypothetical protein